jgi:hypothetical protein
MKPCLLSGFTLTSTRKTVKSCLQTSNIRPTRPAGALRLRLRPPISTASSASDLRFQSCVSCVSKEACFETRRPRCWPVDRPLFPLLPPLVYERFCQFGSKICMARGENLKSLFGVYRSRFLCRDSVLCDRSCRTSGFYSAFCAGSRAARRDPSFIVILFCAIFFSNFWFLFCMLCWLPGCAMGAVLLACGRFSRRCGRGELPEFRCFCAFVRTGRREGSVPALPGSPCRK